MEWTQQKLNHYLKRVRTVVEFEGITGEELDQVFRGEAMRRLQEIETIVQNTDLTDRDKVALISGLLR
ncbi:MAG: hypothetical protein HFF05_04280 [Oscillospiraceae bacterium]|nr:hypothetical protein [Oscillospiraceae bacterium]